MKIQLGFLLAFVLGLAACGSSRIQPDMSTAAVKPDVAKVWVAWVKDKGNKFDMNLNLTNENDQKHIIIYLSDISCARGETQGTIKHTFFNTGERVIDFNPKQTKAFNAVCRLQGKAKGDYSVTVAKIFDNPTGDGKTAGKVIGENLVWKQTDGK